MNLVRQVYAEFLGLFIDDGSLAASSLVLVAVVTGLVKLFGLPPLWAGFLLLVGCVAILAESVLRASRRQGRQDPSRL